MVRLLGDLKECMRILNACSHNHFSKLALQVGDRFITFLFDKQLIRVGKFLKFSFVEHENTICVNDCCQAMRDDKDCAILKALSKRFLDQVVRFQINVCSRLIQNQDFGLADYGSCETKQLLLTD